MASSLLEPSLAAIALVILLASVSLSRKKRPAAPEPQGLSVLGNLFDIPKRASSIIYLALGKPYNTLTKRAVSQLQGYTPGSHIDATSHSPRVFRLPNLEETFSVFPDHGLNPNYTSARTDSRAWINQYTKVVCGPKMVAFMNNCEFELSNSHCYPYAGYKGLKATMDLTNILWLYDEYTDTGSGAEAVKAAGIVARALREPDYDDGTWVCRMMKSFKQNHIDKAGPGVARRFIDNFCNYVEVVGREAELREKNEVLDIPNYVTFRRETSAVRTCFDLVEYCLDLDLPQYVHDDPVFISGYNAGMDLVFWANDLVSYNMEQSKGHSGANVVTVIMKSKGVDLQTAVDFLGGYCEALTAQLLEAKRILQARSDAAYSRDVVRLMDAFGDWVRGNVAWSFETERYFGKENKRVKETLLVELKEPFVGALALKE
uniref:Sesquiterpene synthase Agr5 n=2 Tax=Cyclocybe aegerita TaxID=1973307 RepID=AGR5_CYCAE|nr:RecName: Full=Sesquiterpene synthase Agr5; AltName: Full=Terpene cyclase Agr5; Flags: Precursor [Cyclocybe aegerita]QGA30881.1 sesquiterpene synthase Agr5 [Cyclocybe aegerita]